jgi:hypothetical protein
MNRTKIEWAWNKDGTKGWTWNPIRHVTMWNILELIK